MSLFSDVQTLRSLVKEMKTEVQKISQHLVHGLVEKDKIAKRTDDRLERVTELLTKYALGNGIYNSCRFGPALRSAAFCYLSRAQN